LRTDGQEDQDIQRAGSFAAFGIQGKSDVESSGLDDAATRISDSRLFASTC